VKAGGVRGVPAAARVADVGRRHRALGCHTRSTRSRTRPGRGRAFPLPHVGRDAAASRDRAGTRSFAFAACSACSRSSTPRCTSPTSSPSITSSPSMRSRRRSSAPVHHAGLPAFVLLVPLAVTSTAGWIRRLGGRRWQQLHRLAYVSAGAGVVHYYALVKADTTRPWRYAAIVALLLSARAWVALRRRWPVAGTRNSGES